MWSVCKGYFKTVREEGRLSPQEAVHALELFVFHTKRVNKSVCTITTDNLTSRCYLRMLRAVMPRNAVWVTMPGSNDSEHSVLKIRAVLTIITCNLFTPSQRVMKICVQSIFYEICSLLSELTSGLSKRKLKESESRGRISCMTNTAPTSCHRCFVPKANSCRKLSPEQSPSRQYRGLRSSTTVECAGAQCTGEFLLLATSRSPEVEG